MAFSALSAESLILATIRDQIARSWHDATQRSSVELRFNNTFTSFLPERYVDEVLIIRRNPYWIDAVYAPDAGTVEKIDIFVSDLAAKPQGVAEDYERTLLWSGLSHDRSDGGQISWKVYEGGIRIAVRPKDRDIDGMSRLEVRSPHEQLQFPPPTLVGEVYGTLRGSKAQGKFRGYGPLALAGRSGRGNSPEGATLVPACAAWYLTDRGRIEDTQKRRGLTELLIRESVLNPDSNKSAPHEQLWRDVKKRSDDFQAAEDAFLDSARCHLGANPRDKYF